MSDNMEPKLVVALDVDKPEHALKLLDDLSPLVDWFKVGGRLFLRGGPRICKSIKSKGKNLFLDLKFHDIPNTVYGSVSSSLKLGVDMLTIHTSGGEKMMRAAKEALVDAGKEEVKLLGVTVLTHLGPNEFASLFSSSLEQEQVIVKLADAAKRCGFDGVVASAWELSLLKKNFGRNFIVATPGIRLAQPGAGDDQKRVFTPEKAVEGGSDFLIVGRPIIASADPVSSCRVILDKVHQARP